MQTVGGVFAVRFQEDGSTLNKTWKEIYDAVNDGKLPILFDYQNYQTDIYFVVNVNDYGYGEYIVEIGSLFGEPNLEFTTDSETGYPIRSDQSGGNL